MARILVVDDNASMREAVCEMLEQVGYVTVGAENGRNVAQIHRNDPVDLIITDLFMPDTDGQDYRNFWRRYAWACGTSDSRKKDGGPARLTETFCLGGIVSGGQRTAPSQAH